MVYHETVANLYVFVGDIEQDQLVGPRFEGVIVSRSAHCDMNWATVSSSPTLIWARDHAQKTSSNAKNIRVHSLCRHRQQLASCATLWRLFPTRDREHELSFLLLFVFSLRKRKKCGERRREGKRLNTTAVRREKLSVGKWNCERSFAAFSSSVPYTIFLKRLARAMHTNFLISRRAFLAANRNGKACARSLADVAPRLGAYCTETEKKLPRENFYLSRSVALQVCLVIAARIITIY